MSIAQTQDKAVKLVCYPVSGEPPLIRPASTSRQWMDDSHDNKANRCLPLLIANAAGWEVLNPVAFSATWTGGPKRSDVIVKSDVGTPIGISHFGSGILTFHVTGLFRTPEGAMLWVGGLPNHIKDGIQALTGLIETSWSPYTFSMNWRFTRPGHTVRFEKDEAFCFFFPIDIGMIEAVDPVFRPLSENANLEKTYKQWSKSRDRFNADLRIEGSDAKKQKWQKNYHKGVYPDGTRSTVKHRTRVRLKPFVHETN
jgi:hypothetical protein